MCTANSEDQSTQFYGVIFGRFCDASYSVCGVFSIYALRLTD